MYVYIKLCSIFKNNAVNHRKVWKVIKSCLFFDIKIFGLLREINKKPLNIEKIIDIVIHISNMDMKIEHQEQTGNAQSELPSPSEVPNDPG